MLANFTNCVKHRTHLLEQHIASACTIRPLDYLYPFERPSSARQTSPPPARNSRSSSNLYGERHQVTGVPLEDWDVRVDTQTEADLDYAIKKGCDYIVFGTALDSLPGVVAPAPPPTPPAGLGSRREQVPLLPIVEPWRRGGQQQPPTAPIPQGRLSVPPPEGKQDQIAPPPRVSGP